MNTAELDDLLKRTLADGRLAQAEKKVLADWAALHAGDENGRALARSRAFAIARTAAAPALDWLEEAVKVFSRPAQSAKPAEGSLACFSPGPACLNEIQRQLGNARTAVEICVFTITDDRITDAIIRAHQKGVKVRVLTDDDKSCDLGSDIERLRDAGIPCATDTSPAHMHHKFAVFDGARLLSGSFNWTRGATEMNEENLLVTADPGLVAPYARRFAELWAKFAGK